MAKTKMIQANEVEPTISQPAPEYKRTFTGTKEVLTDLFKLMTATVIKYEGWEPDKEHPETHANKYSHWEHTHPFRTYDRKGSKLETSTPIGGHFHVVKWEPSTDPNVPPKILSVSGPMVMQRKRVKGKETMVPVPANDFDEHTHDIEYIRTSRMEHQSTNLEAQKVIAWDAQKYAPVPEVGDAGAR